MMSRYYSYISSASAIIEAYKGVEPFVHFIKKHFAVNKKFGSRDRKIIATLCYCYFRVKHAFENEPVSEVILKGLFLCESQSNAVLEATKPEWNQMLGLNIADKWTHLSAEPSALFPFAGELGDDIDKQAFAESFLQQPMLFLRSRPGKKDKVLSSLHAAGIRYSLMEENCIALQNATSLEKVLRFNKEAVVQDYNSQKVFDASMEALEFLSENRKPTAWDCCAASGGKSILLYDKLKGNCKLTVSDIRNSILANLTKRLQEAAVPVYQTLVTDLTQPPSPAMDNYFNIIICDAPCTGSGTWSRTPEQLAFFKTAFIEAYASKQKKIAGNALTRLQQDGLFFYITCSVFKKENEEVVAFLQKEHSLSLLNMQYLKGYGMKADTMFVAVFKRKQSQGDQVAGDQ